MKKIVSGVTGDSDHMGVSDITGVSDDIGVNDVTGISDDKGLGDVKGVICNICVSYIKGISDDKGISDVKGVIWNICVSYIKGISDDIGVSDVTGISDDKGFSNITCVIEDICLSDITGITDDKGLGDVTGTILKRRSRIIFTKIFSDMKMPFSKKQIMFLKLVCFEAETKNYCLNKKRSMGDTNKTKHQNVTQNLVSYGTTTFKDILLFKLLMSSWIHFSTSFHTC